MISFLATLLLNQQSVDISLKVDGIERTGTLVKPNLGTGKAPLIFAFHGHGGNGRQARRSFAIEEQWPEAAVVYLNGIPTPGQLTDPEGKKNGWQKGQGAEGDRDIKFFNAALNWVKSEIKVDDKRVYTMGHSNGGAFSYLLWSVRPDVFAAIGVSAGGFRTTDGMKPVPLIHIGGTADPLVRFRGQEMAVARARLINECETEGKTWNDVEGATIWDSPKNAPVVFVVHDGGHEYWNNSSEVIVKFFKSMQKK